MEENYRMTKAGKRTENLLNVSDVVKSISMIVFASAISFGFWKLGFSEANIIMVYIIGVLITSIITNHQIYSLISSIVSVIVFNFLYTEPRYTLLAYEKDYPVTFLTMFAAAFLTGSLAIRLKRQAKQAAQAAYRTGILLETNRLLEGVREKKEIVAVAATQLIKLLGRDMVIYPVIEGDLSDPMYFAVDGETVREEYLSEKEREVALWVLQNNQHAGATTDTFAGAGCLYLSIPLSSCLSIFFFFW